MKRRFIGGLIVMISLLSLTSCCDYENAYKVKFKYKIGEFVQHRVSEDKILIIDTIRSYDCIGDDSKVELGYRGINSAENENYYNEIELTK